MQNLGKYEGISASIAMTLSAAVGVFTLLHCTPALVAPRLHDRLMQRRGRNS
jgi:hypothetical protein